MKVTFDSDKNRNDIVMMVNSGSYYSSLWDISMMFREYRKYHAFKTVEAQELVEDLEQEFFDILDQNHVNLDEVN